MRRSWFPSLLVIGLLGLLVVLATLQYRWLDQISQAERERLQRNLQSDTVRFAEDFDREIQNAYFNFQINEEDIQEQNWGEFNARYEFWRKKTAYPNLIKDFYLIPAGGNFGLLRFDTENKTFAAAEPNEELNKIKQSLIANQKFEAIFQDIPALLMPIYEKEEPLKQILIRRNNTTTETIPPPLNQAPPAKYGVLIIKLDDEVIKNQIFPDLVKKYFSVSESANYKLAVTNQDDQTVFQTQNINSSDASAKLFNLETDNFIFYANQGIVSSIQDDGKGRVISSHIETRGITGNVSKKEINREINQESEKKQINLQVVEDDSLPRSRFFEASDLHQNGIWTLKVQHENGSVAQYVTNVRRKNLAVSFGILSLLAASIVLIIISAQRSKRLAQRQIDFVSAVSHEFRTPLAVIYSAGENLSDGVIREESRILNYGNLIKREGKKLSGMVEQILEFAGARSGKRKYDFRRTGIERIIEEAIAECKPTIDEKGVTIEREINKSLPAVSADEKALTQAIQNLIHNALKYDSGRKWLRISAGNGNNKIKITVEDKGIGIEKREIGKIFEPFFRAKSVVDAQIHGNGLGLSLVKQIVEAHKGEIRVESEAGKGSRFTIELPAGN